MKNSPAGYPAKLNIAIAAGVVSAVLNLVSPLTAAAEIYRWSDAHGKLSLSDRKPSHREYQRVDPGDLPPVHVTPPPAARSTPARQLSPPRTKKPKPAAKKRLDCTRYEKKLDVIERKLWSGYREPAGNKLRAKRREYRALLINCRRNS